MGYVLYHHGIEGQHWGERNGPPYPLSSSQKSSREKYRAAKKTKKQERAEKNQEKAVKNRSYISDEELSARIKRAENEIRLRDLTEKNLHPGRAKVKEILQSSGGKAATALLTGAALYGAKLLVSGKFKRWNDAGEREQMRIGLADAMFNGGPKKK